MKVLRKKVGLPEERPSQFSERPKFDTPLWFTYRPQGITRHGTDKWDSLMIARYWPFYAAATKARELQQQTPDGDQKKLALGGSRQIAAADNTLRPRPLLGTAGINSAAESMIRAL